MPIHTVKEQEKKRMVLKERKKPTMILRKKPNRFIDKRRLAEMDRILAKRKA